MKGERRTLIYNLLGAAAALVVLVLLIMWMAGFFGEKIEPGTASVPGATAPADARTATVFEETVPVVEEAAGTVQAERKTLISSRILALIREMRTNAGDEVHRGETLIELDDREASARAQEARRAVEAAEAEHRRRANDFERVSQLLRDGVLSQSEFDQAESTFRVAAAEAERARQALQAAEVMLTYAKIISPVDGRVIERFADPGDTAVPGEPLLALHDPSALRMEVPVREALVSRLKIGEVLGVRMAADQSILTGTIDEIVPQAEAGSRTFLMKVGLPKRDGVYTGMFGRVVIPVGERKRVLIPADGVERVGQLTFVTVMDSNRKLSRRLITVGPAVGNERLEVLSGLLPGETVVVQHSALSAP